MANTEANFTRLRRWLSVSVLVLSLLLAVLAGAFVSFDQQRSRHEAAVKLQADAQTFAEYVTATLRAAHVVLEAARAEFERRGGFDALSEAQVHAMFLEHLRLITATGAAVPANALVLVDASGRIFSNSLSLPVPRRDLSDLAYFAHHRSTRTAETWLGPLYVSRSTGLLIFTLSQRLEDAGGNFRGVLLITLRAAHFEDFFRQMELEPGQSITLFRHDGKALFRYPMIEHFETADIGHELTFQAMLREGRGARLIMSPFDRTLRLSGFAVARSYPFLASVSRPQNDVLKDWRKRAWIVGGLAATAIVGLLTLLGFAWRQIGRAQQAQRARQNAEDERAALEVQLLQAEKLASLGRLVAVFAHDIGAPIGNGMVAISTLQERSLEVRQALAGGSLRRSDFEDYLGTADEAALLVRSNLGRAVDLLDDFKQSALDQATSQRRTIELGHWLKSLVHSLSPLFKGGALRCELHVDGPLSLDTLPGPLAQVISNLVGNACVHAFAPGQSGLIRIEARALPTGVQLCVGDDGRGMSAEILDRIFEPFFTTRAHAGGTGLGLHIVRNLVEERLGGRISVESRPGAGSRFVIELPADLPSEEPAASGAAQI